MLKSVMAMAALSAAGMASEPRMYVPRAERPKLAPEQQAAIEAAKQERLDKGAAKRARQAARQAKGMQP